MPDPRQPQRPGQRQPAPQPQRGQPQDPKAGAAAKQGLSRPVRPLDPSQQAPPVEFARKLRKGETYWVMGSEELPQPLKGKIIRLSSEVGKAVGVEFNEPIGGVDDTGQPFGTTHTCDGRGKLGYCLYVRPDQVLDEKAMQAHKAHQIELGEESNYEEYDEITVGPQDSQPLTPAMPAFPLTDRETMSIGPGDVGKISATDLFKSKPKDEDEDE